MGDIWTIMRTGYGMPPRVGDIVRIRPFDDVEEVMDDGGPPLFRTPSTYSYGFSLHLHPDPMRTYVVCGRGNGVLEAMAGSRSFVLCVQGDSTLTVGFGLFYDAVGNSYTRVTQVGFDPVPVEVEVVGRADSYPLDRCFVGSQVMVARGI